MTETHIGFTGTRNGLTILQMDVLGDLLIVMKEDSCVAVWHFGDCVGADEQAFNLIHANNMYTIGHPPNKDDLRAFCHYDKEREPKDFINRNHDIVDECEYLITCPGEMVEQLRSGTWATWRYAKQKSKFVVTIYPDGSVEYIEPK